MDEIICPECGRPNLIEAEKCWYCQIPLVNKEAGDNAPEETADNNTDLSNVENTKTKLADTEESDENLPDWLKRIRELKKADTPVEEVDQWEQEKLFTGLTQEIDTTINAPGTASRPVRSHGLPDPKLASSEGQPLLKETPAEDILEEEVDPDKNEPDDSENELPEGFTPLEH